jgi:hypothetical protein
MEDLPRLLAGSAYRIDQPLRRDFAECNATRPHFMQQPASAAIDDLENAQPRTLIKKLVNRVSLQRTISFDDNHIGLGSFQQCSEVWFVNGSANNFHVTLRRDRVPEHFEQ